MSACCSYPLPELVYKAAGGKVLPAGRSIASAVRDVFQQQSMVYNPRTFRHWDSRLAVALEKPLLSILTREAKKATKESGSNFDAQAVSADLLALSRSRAIASAASINGTTLERYENQEADPFSAQRAAEIAITEASWAAHAAEGVVMKGKTWKWVAEANACPACRKLDGKKRTVGKSFGEVAHPPLHPSCKCVVEVV